MVVDSPSAAFFCPLRPKLAHSFYNSGVLTRCRSTRSSAPIAAPQRGPKKRRLLLALVARTAPLLVLLLRQFIDCAVCLTSAALEATAAPAMHVEKSGNIKSGTSNARQDAPSASLSSPSSFQNDMSESEKVPERAKPHGASKRAGAENRPGPKALQRQAGNCLPCMGFAARPPYDQRSLGGGLSFCHEHASNTCCERKHSDELLRRFLSSFRPEVNQGVELPMTFPPNDCRSYTAAALCSRCDARVGSGEMARGNVAILCPTFCRQWYMACEDEYFAAAPSGSAWGLSFCTEDSLICSSLSHITRDSSAFCRLLGFEVADDVPVVAPDKNLGATPPFTMCYDGVPAAIALGAATLAPRKHATVSASPTDHEATREFAGFFERVFLFFISSFYRMRCLLVSTASHPGFWLVVLLILHGFRKAARRLPVPLQGFITGCFNGRCSLNPPWFTAPCPLGDGTNSQQEPVPSDSRHSNAKARQSATILRDKCAAAAPVCSKEKAVAGQGNGSHATAATELPSSADISSPQEGDSSCRNKTSQGSVLPRNAGFFPWKQRALLSISARPGCEEDSGGTLMDYVNEDIDEAFGTLTGVKGNAEFVDKKNGR